MSRFFSGKGGGRLRPRSFFELPGKGDMAAILAQSTGRRFDPSILGASNPLLGSPWLLPAPLRQKPSHILAYVPHLVRLCGSLNSGDRPAGRCRMRPADGPTTFSRQTILCWWRLRRQFSTKSVWDVLRKAGSGHKLQLRLRRRPNLPACALLLALGPGRDRLDKI